MNNFLGLISAKSRSQSTAPPSMGAVLTILLRSRETVLNFLILSKLQIHETAMAMTTGRRCTFYQVN